MKSPRGKPRGIKPAMPDTGALDCIYSPLQQITSEANASLETRQAARN